MCDYSSVPNPILAASIDSTPETHINEEFDGDDAESNDDDDTVEEI